MDISRLSESAQRQILAKLGQQAKPTKYRNEKATRRMPNGTIRTFDSQKEARRYDELVLLLKAGEISDLRLQQTFTLQEGYISASGDAVRAPGIRITAGVVSDLYRSMSAARGPARASVI